MGIFGGAPKPPPVAQSLIKARDPINNAFIEERRRNKKIAGTSLLGTDESNTLGSATLLGG